MTCGEERCDMALVNPTDCGNWTKEDGCKMDKAHIKAKQKKQKDQR